MGIEEENGFSLIELLIVVAIILIIAAIAIPNFLHSRMSANETSAAGSLRSINTACVTYTTSYGIGFPSSLATLGTSGAASSTSADILDSVLASGVKSGYTFTYVAGPQSSGMVLTYIVNADPVVPGQTGIRHFYTDQSFVIRFNVSAAATVSDSPIQ